MLQECFETRNIELLQKAISELPEDQAKYHLKRCVDSGLWIPDASKADKDNKNEATGESSTTAAETAAAAPETDTTESPSAATE